MRKLNDTVKRITALCLCHRALYAMAAGAHAAGAVHAIGEVAVLAVCGAVYLVMALRG